MLPFLAALLGRGTATSELNVRHTCGKQSAPRCPIFPYIAP